MRAAARNTRRMKFTLTTLAFSLAGLVAAEEASILTGASVSPQIDVLASSGIAPLIDGDYRSLQEQKHDNGNGDAELSIILSESKKIISAFVQNRADDVDAEKDLGQSAIYIGDDTQYLST